MRALRYAVDEALASLWRGRQAGLLSTLTIALALFVLGAFLLLTSNLQRLSEGWSHAAELSVYLQDGIPQAEQTAVEAALRQSPIVAADVYVSKDEARRRFKQMFGELTAAMEGVGENPLPASFEARLQASAQSSESIDVLAARLMSMPGVADVRYDGQWLDRLLTAVAVIRTVGFGLGAVLTIAAALTVANVVRLALYGRRDEIDIMQLVGAPTAYIRGPFVVEGILQGGVGAVLALAALGVGFVAVRARYVAPLTSTLDLTSVQFLSVGSCLFLVVGGMLVGCLGGALAARTSSASNA